jgi:uncharacterized protein YprB with RNaseH-like and TPR domain
MTSLMDRLKSLGVTVGPANLDLPVKKPFFDKDLAQTLGGELQETIYGTVIRIVKHYPLGFTHGNIHCEAPITQDVFRKWGNLPEECPPRTFLFLDTETSGLSSGTGIFAFLVGIGFFLEDGFHLIQYFLETPANEPAMLASLIQDISDTQILVTYNGKSFDIPLLRNRLIMNRIQNPLDVYFHADLLHITRKIYKLFLPERNLGIVEKEILKFQRDEQEVPGWMVPEIYAEFLRNHDPEPIKRVLYHNQIDIVSLAALYQHLNELLAASFHNPVEIPHAVSLSMIRLYTEMGNLETAESVLQQLIVESDFSMEYAKTCHLLAMGLKQANLTHQALAWWKKAGQYGYSDAWIELAKYYEHQIGNYALALDYTEKAIQASSSSGIPYAENQHRKSRLERLLRAE